MPPLARVVIVCFLTVLAPAHVVMGAVPGPTPNAATTALPASAAPTPPDCGTTLQSLVDAAPPGAVLAVPPCVFRETVRLTKPVTLDGQGRAEVRGSDVWDTGWSRVGALWLHGGAPAFPDTGGYCAAGTERCHWPEQVFLDGLPLLQVGSTPTNGQFSIDGGWVILADDPRGRTVEVTTRQFWVIGEASDVVIQGFTMRHGASPAQRGSLLVVEQSNWTVQNNTLSDAHGAVFTIEGGSGFRLLNNDIARAGSVGAGASEASTILFQGNRIHHNNTEEFDAGWSGGGSKNALVTGMVFDANDVFSNNGPGLWCDVFCEDVTFSNNRIHQNGSEGIKYEISGFATIYGNTLWENGWSGAGWCFGAGILVQNSHHVEVFGNVLAWNQVGGSVISQNREGANDVVENHFHDNIIVSQAGVNALAYCHDWGESTLFEPGSNNRGANNRYWYPGPEGSEQRFGWADGGIPTLAEFGATAGEENGRYLTAAEKDAVLASEAMPATPEAR